MRPLWVFDLDNTLHDAVPHIFPHINRSMTDYLQQHLGLDRDEADGLRKRYWEKYGATLCGLMRHHETEPDHFLRHTHDFPELSKMVVRDPTLKRSLRALRGRKVVFSNAPLDYALSVLKILGVAEYFDEVFSIEHSKYRPKPDRYGFFRIFGKVRKKPSMLIMVEDDLENLRTAKKLGMGTVWVTSSRQKPAYVDMNVSSIGELARRQFSLYK